MIKGKELTLNWLKKQSQAIQNEVRDAVEDATDGIYQQAVLNAPGPGDEWKTTYGTQKIQDNIRSMLSKEFTNNGYTGAVYANSQASKFFVFREFSTGTDAARYIPTLPKEFQEFARKYYVNGKGAIIGQPFLLPAYFKYRTEFVKNLKKIVEKNRG